MIMYVLIVIMKVNYMKEINMNKKQILELMYMFLITLWLGISIIQKIHYKDIIAEQDIIIQSQTANIDTLQSRIDSIARLTNNIGLFNMTFR